MKIEIKDIHELPVVAQNLLDSFPDDRFFAFFGKMGVGKTTLIKELCAALGVEDNVCSPTFAIVNEYRRRDGEPVFHFDFYRMKSVTKHTTSATKSTSTATATASPSGPRRSKSCSQNATCAWTSKSTTEQEH